MKGSECNFHGGCSDCDNDISICPNCRYFKCNWSLPNKNNKYIEEEKRLNRLRKIAIQKNKIIITSKQKITKIYQEDNMKDYICPNNHIFGEDWDDYKECFNCKIRNKCEKKWDELNAIFEDEDYQYDLTIEDYEEIENTIKKVIKEECKKRNKDLLKNNKDLSRGLI